MEASRFQLNKRLSPPTTEILIMIETSTEAIDVEVLKGRVIDTLRTCFDPEIPVNIYDLGLIYEINAEPSGDVLVRMTLTAPGCPVAGSLPQEVEDKIRAVPGVKDARVQLVWDPPWCSDRMSDAAKLQLNML
jgi:FeS assembly SUF system protein